MNTTLDVALFDYGAGNLHSLKKALESGGARVAVTQSWDEALARDALVLPGVGSFGAAVRSLEGEADRVRTVLEEGLPCLGICLGMQLFFEDSEEGEGEGIGLLEGTVRRLKARIVPQMGWNDVRLGGTHSFAGGKAPADVDASSPADIDASSPADAGASATADAGASATADAGVSAETDPLFRGVGELVAYYANSYVCEGPETEAVIAVTDYQGDRFAAGVRKARSWGVQFHPEKSSAPGLRIIQNFLGEVGR